MEKNNEKGNATIPQRAGIRYIKSIVIESEDDIRKFWKENKLKKGMVKYSESASSIGNKVVFSSEEAIEHYNHLKSNLTNVFGVKTEVLLQEFIDGEEYIVDSVSCEGKHMITDIWKYNKIVTKDNNVIYDSTFLVTNLDGEIYNLVRYAFKVLDATGFVYGPCHGEYKIDDNGPVLIETNARPIGLSMNREFLDECLGHHITEIALDSYLYPKMFDQHKLKPYRPKRFAVLKSFISNKEFDANIKPLGIILGLLKSYRWMTTIGDEKIHVPKTIDLDTSIITIKMCHKDKSMVEKDLRLIELIEKHPELVIEFEKDSKLIPVKSDWKKIFQYVPRDRKTLVVTNEDRHTAWYGNAIAIDDNWDSYDNLIYAYTGGKKLSEIYSSFLMDAAKVRHGGMIVVVPEFIEKVPCGAIGVQMLLNVAGFVLEMPIIGFEKYMVAVKSIY